MIVYPHFICVENNTRSVVETGISLQAAAVVSNEAAQTLELTHGTPVSEPPQPSRVGAGRLGKADRTRE